ncbi:MAG TPA: hypothetical protein DDW52_04305 [Planctomycetaceae bacterium]|nr:hypothetical protein [Planctomycetaceae bacterium]
MRSIAFHGVEVDRVGVDLNASAARFVAALVASTRVQQQCWLPTEVLGMQGVSHQMRFTMSGCQTMRNYIENVPRRIAVCRTS